MNTFISYTDTKNKKPIQVIDSRYQVNHITPNEIQLFEEFNTHPLIVHARLFVIIFKHKQIEMISDGNKVIEIRVL